MTSLDSGAHEPRILIRNSHREASMPEYEYLCNSCHKIFDIHLTLDAHEHDKVKCPKCGSTDIEQQYPAFFAVSEKKS